MTATPVPTTAELEAMSLSELTDRLDEERSARDPEALAQLGPGPGGVHTEWDGHLFGGPTAARAALELALSADEAGFHRLRYESNDARRVGAFPPDSSDGMDPMDAQSLPVRGRYTLMEWFIEI